MPNKNFVLAIVKTQVIQVFEVAFEAFDSVAFYVVERSAGNKARTVVLHKNVLSGWRMTNLQEFL